MQKRLEYNKKDSAVAFLLALVVPTLLTLIISLICGMVFPNFVYTDKLVGGEIQKVYSNTFYYIMLAVNQFGFLLSFLIYNKATSTDIKSASQVKWKLNIWQILIIIAIGLIAMYGFTYLISYFEYLMKLGGYESTSFDYLKDALLSKNFGIFMASTFVVAILPAICEESIFRGICLNGLKKMGTVLAIVLSGLMFCIMHLSLEQCLYQFVLGMVLASVVVITGSIFASAILHFFNNFWILLTTFISNNVSETEFVPQNIFDHIWPFLVAIASVVVIYFLLVLLKKLTKNSECEIFNLRLKNKNKENINNNAETENQVVENQENVSLTKNSTLVKEADNGNTWLIISFAVGIILWIISVVSDFML